jgi:hypothetical protein
MRRLLVTTLLLAAATRVTWAQRVVPPALAPAEARPASGRTVPLFPQAQRADTAGGRADGWPVLASAILPGAGQAMLRQDRAIIYVALEALFIARYVRGTREGNDERDRYRTLASNVARALYSDVRPIGDFEYYERMEKYVESGVYDVNPGGELEPETDTATFNGATWLLARQTYWADADVPPPRDSPEFARALSFYAGRAYDQAYRWSWRNAQLEYDEYRQTIRKSNDAYKTAATDLGLLIANHVLSTVDAFVTVRLRARAVATGSGTSRWEVSGSVPFGGPDRAARRN